MGYFLKDRCCLCGGFIEVIPFKDKPQYQNKYISEYIVSHGICIECLNTTILPPEHFHAFVKENCIYKEI